MSILPSLSLPALRLVVGLPLEALLTVCRLRCLISAEIWIVFLGQALPVVCAVCENGRGGLVSPQVSDRVEECRFELHHPSLWRSMSSEVLMSVSSPGSSSLSPSPPPLYGSSLDPIVASGEFELQLRRLVSQHRKVGIAGVFYSFCPLCRLQA